MFKLLMLTVMATALGDDTCTPGDSGECVEESSVLQVPLKPHMQIASQEQFPAMLLARGDYDTIVIQDGPAGVIPEPSKQCKKKFTQDTFKMFKGIADGLVQAGTAKLGDVEETKEYSRKVWGSWFGCDTTADLNLTGAVQGINTTSLADLECIETNYFNTKFTAWVEVKMDSLTFAGTGTAAIDRTGKCLIGDKLIPETSATIGATLKNITLSALVDVASMKVDNASDIHFSYDKITDLKCGAMTKPVNLSFMNEVCSFFLTPVVNIFKKPTIRMINKALNVAIAKHFAGNSSAAAGAGQE